MEDSETFTLLPLRYDAESKEVSSLGGSTNNGSSNGGTKNLTRELEILSSLHQMLAGLETVVPPPPVPVNPKRSAQITKLREAGNNEFRKGRHGEAVKFYTLGLQMALTRPPWEPSGLVRDEVAGLFANRAQAHMASQNWPEGCVDAESSVEAKRVGNAKAWWRKGKCLLEMGRWAEAREWVGKGLEMEGNEADLAALLKEIEAKEKGAA